eukprot:7338024-Ditylum_brightwellii.AAC.1
MAGKFATPDDNKQQNQRPRFALGKLHQPRKAIRPRQGSILHPSLDGTKNLSGEDETNKHNEDEDESDIFSAADLCYEADGRCIIVAEHLDDNNDGSRRDTTKQDNLKCTINDDTQGQWHEAS